MISPVKIRQYKKLLTKHEFSNIFILRYKLNNDFLMTVQIAGKYTFVSQENFEDYLKAEDVGMIIRNVLASTKPDIVVEIDGDNFTITTVTSLKTIKMSFTLGKEYESDPGTNKIGKYITTFEGSDTLFTQNVEDTSATSSIKFSNDQMIMTMTTNGITATRTFKRA